MGLSLSRVSRHFCLPEMTLELAPWNTDVYR
jgi:hypothetical protein